MLFIMARHISDDSPLKCPKCGQDMASQTVGDVTLERCTGCTGLWMKASAMERLMARKDLARVVDTGGGATTANSPSEASANAVLICPNDRSRLIRMVNHKQPHVQYESCKTCGGVFLDAGELRDLASHGLMERLRALFGRK